MPKLLTTSEFAKALGVSESSVRRMADAGELQFHRTRGGHRRIPVPEAVRYVRESKTRILRPDLLGLEVDPSEVSLGTVEEKMLAVLRAGHASAVISLMQSLYASGMSIASMCDGPIAHAMDVIGAAWPHDKKAIFIEHRATILCCRALNQLRLSIPDPEVDAPQAIGGAMSGDRYLLPTLMASLVMHDLGFNETNLGPDLPLDVLTDCVADEKPALLWLSVCEPIRSRTQLREVSRLGEVASQSNTRFIIGGRYARDLEETWGAQHPTSWSYCEHMRCLETDSKPILDGKA
ncbi:MAG: helix-turn-helix domain-containing protein [Planctomycetota bacterium]